MNIEKVNDAFLCSFKIEKLSSTKEVLFISDVHFDSTKCDRASLKCVLDEAITRNAHIFIFGDWLDVMGAKFDPRSTKSDIRPEYQSSNYFMDVVDDSVKFLKPYASHLVFISQGNHELSVKRRHEIDLLQAISYKLRVEAAWTGYIGDYEGWLVFYAKRASDVYTMTAYYTHGTGGNAPVTRGVISTNRRQVNIEADLFISGHIHTQWAMPIPRRRLNLKKVEVIKNTVHLQLGTYKESQKGYNSWEAMKGFSAPSIGGYFVRFYVKDNTLLLTEERTR